MIRRIILALACAAAIEAVCLAPKAHAQQAFNQQWGQTYSTQDWNRLYHYPYVYYPQNFWGPDYYRSSGNMYNRYPPEMQIPVYNRQWQNEYPQDRRYYQRASLQSGRILTLDSYLGPPRTPPPPSASDAAARAAMTSKASVEGSGTLGAGATTSKLMSLLMR